MYLMQYMDNQLFIIIAHEASVKTYEDTDVALWALQEIWGPLLSC